MEKTKPKRRRQAKPKVENYYKVLGLRSNARHERIKQSYIQLVKQYPPEQFPEEFERIRKAYEALRDPVKREEYDLMRKYGGSLEKMMNEATEYLEQENWDKAEKLFSEILKIAPKSNGARVGMAQVQLSKNNFDEFDKHMQLFLEGTDSVENQVKVLSFKAKMLIEADYPERALAVLELLSDGYSEYADIYRVLFIQVYQALDRWEEAMEMIEAEIPSLESQETEHISVFIAWINAMMEMEKWQLSDKIQKRVRKFLKSVTDDDDRLMVASALIYEYEGFYQSGMFREAGMYMDLLYSFDPKHPIVLEQRRDVQELTRIQKEIDRIAKDDDLFPMVTMKVFELFYEEYTEYDVVSAYKEMIPFGILQEMEHMDEEFAAGIKRLKKKYPLTYRRYQDEWDELFAEKSSGLNREARRRLR